MLNHVTLYYNFKSHAEHNRCVLFHTQIQEKGQSKMAINFINPTFSLLNSIQPVSTQKNSESTNSANGGTAFSDVLDSVISNTNLQNYSGNQAAVSTSGNTTVNLDEIFQKAAETYNVPVRLLKAVAKAESNFDTNSESGSGAQGIMQLMPGTAKALGVTNSFDPEQNIMGGAKYLSQQLARYDGNEVLALAAYNAGPGNVAKYGGVPPFEETQNYIKKVMAYAGESITAGETTLVGQASSISSGNSLQDYGLGLLNEAANGTADMKDYETIMNLYRLKMQLNILSDSDSDSNPDSNSNSIVSELSGNLI